MTTSHTPSTLTDIPAISGRDDIDSLKRLIRIGTTWFRDNVVDNEEEEAQLTWESCFYTQMFDTLEEADFTADSLTSASFDPDAVQWLDYAVELGIKGFERDPKLHPTTVAELEELRAIHDRLQARADAISAHAIDTYVY